MHYELTSLPSIIPQLLNISTSAGAANFLLRHTTFGERRHQNKTSVPSCHNHDLFHIVLFVGGENCFSLEGKAVPCKAGTLAITSPGQPHDFGPLQPGELTYHELTFSLVNDKGSELAISFRKYIANLFGLEQTPEIPVISQCDVDEMQTLCELYKKQCHALKISGGKNLSENYRHIFSLLECIAEFFVFHKANRPKKISKLQRAKEYIAGNYSGDISLDEIAKIASLSKYHFCRAFHKKFGISPKAYQVELRLQAAAQLLKTSGLNCGEIANKLGFSDQYFFSAAFKKRFGLSPRNFVKRMENN